MIYKQIRPLLRRYCFNVTVIACAVTFCCGTVTVSQKTAYNIYLKKYSVMSMTNTSQKISLSIDSHPYSLMLPDKEKTEHIKRLMKFTPLAPFVYILEVLSK